MRRQKTIVCIDDDVTSLNILKRQLQAAGYKVVAFTKPEEAYQQLLWFPPDAIVVDLYMPKLSGIELIQRLHQRGEYHCPPCLVVSGADEEAAITSVYEAGAVDFLRKPYVQGELFAKLKRMLREEEMPESPEALPSPARIGKYRVIEEIGRGGMGVVYKVQHKDSEEILALKAIIPHSDDTNLLLRFRREIDLLSTFSHPNLIHIRGAGRTSSLYFYVMDYINGPSLKGFCKSQGRLEPEAAAFLLRTLGAALQYLHDHNVVHRDIKPSNILLSETGQLFLVDFGLAKCFLDTQVTHHSGLVGTPSFLAPEVIRGEAIDGRSDLFSLGMVSLELLLGEPVIEGDNPYSIMIQVAEGQFTKAAELPEVPTELAAIIDRLLAVDPDQRFQDGASLLKALEETSVIIDGSQFKRQEGARSS